MSTTATPTPATRLLTVNEAAAYCRISRATVYRRIQRGELPAVRVGNNSGVLRVPEHELEAWLYGEPGPPVPEPEHPQDFLEPAEVAARLGVSLRWVIAQRFDLPCLINATTTELRGVRVGALEVWERAARAAFPSHRGGIGANG